MKRYQEPKDKVSQPEDEAPNGARIEVTVLISKGKWAALKAQGNTDDMMDALVEKGIYSDPQSPILDIDSARIIKYY